MTKSADIYNIAWDLAKMVEQLEEAILLTSHSILLDNNDQPCLDEVRLVKVKLQKLCTSLVGSVQAVENITFNLEEELKDIYPEFIAEDDPNSNQHFS